MWRAVRPRGPGGSMKYQVVYLNVATICLNDLDSVCRNGLAGQGKLSRRSKVVMPQIHFRQCIFLVIGGITLCIDLTQYEAVRFSA